MTPGLTATVADVLARHVQVTITTGLRMCICGDWTANMPGGSPGDDARHRAHVAVEVTNALTTALAQPEVIEAAARGITGLMVDGKWSDQTPAHFAKVALIVAADELNPDRVAIPGALGAGGEQ